MKLEIELSDSLYQWLENTAKTRGKDLETCFTELLEEHAAHERRRSRNRAQTSTHTDLINKQT